MHENEIAKIIVGSAYHVHKELGPGLLESTYEACLDYELSERGLHTQNQHILPVTYRDIKVNCGYRIDILVENSVIIELKAVEEFNDVHLAQILTYMKLSKCKLGFLINFNVKWIKDGLKRIVLGDL